MTLPPQTVIRWITKVDEIAIQMWKCESLHKVVLRCRVTRFKIPCGTPIAKPFATTDPFYGSTAIELGKICKGNVETDLHEKYAICELIYNEFFMQNIHDFWYVLPGQMKRDVISIIKTLFSIKHAAIKDKYNSFLRCVVTPVMNIF